MKPSPFISHHDDELGQYWTCMHCRRCYLVKPKDIGRACLLCRHEVTPTSDRVVIAISVGTFCVLIVLAWIFAYLCGWLS